VYMNNCFCRWQKYVSETTWRRCTQPLVCTQSVRRRRCSLLISVRRHSGKRRTRSTRRHQSTPVSTLSFRATLRYVAHHTCKKRIKNIF